MKVKPFLKRLILICIALMLSLNFTLADTRAFITGDKIERLKDVLPDWIRPAESVSEADLIIEHYSAPDHSTLLRDVLIVTAVTVPVALFVIPDEIAIIKVGIGLLFGVGIGALPTAATYNYVRNEYGYWSINRITNTLDKNRSEFYYFVYLGDYIKGCTL